MAIRFRQLAAAALALSASSWASADSIEAAPELVTAALSLQVCIGEPCTIGVDGRFASNQAGTVFDLAPEPQFDPQSGFFGGAGLFSDFGDYSGAASFSGHVDPDIAVGGMVFDFGAPTRFTFLATAPLVPPLTSHAVISGDMSASCTDMNGDRSCGAGAGSLAPHLFTLLVNGAEVGPSLGTSSIVAAPIGSATIAADSGMRGIDCAPLGGCQLMTAVFSFTGSGNGDLITFNGKYSMVPEPMSLLLGLAAVLMLALRARSPARAI